MRMHIVLLLTLSAGLAGPAGAWAQGADAEAQPPSLQEVRALVERLASAAETLEDLGFRSQSRDVEALAERIDPAAAAEAGVSPATVSAAGDAAERVQRLHDMYDNAGQAERAGALAEHLATLEQAHETLSGWVVQSAPAAASAAGVSPAGAIEQLTVALRRGPHPHAAGAADRNSGAGASRRTSNRRRSSSGPPPGSLPPGVTPPPGWDGGSGPSRSSRSRSRNDDDEPAGPEVLHIQLREVGETFYQLRDFERYLEDNAATLAQTPVVLEVSGDLEWRFVASVLRTLGEAPLHGPMGFADVTLRAEPAAAPPAEEVAAAPAEPRQGPEAPPAQPSETPQPPAEPAERSAPAERSEPAGDAAAELLGDLPQTTAEKRDVLFIVGLDRTHGPAAAAMLNRWIPQLPDNARFTVMAMQGDRATRVVDNVQANAAGVAQARQALSEFDWPRQPTDLASILMSQERTIRETQATVFLTLGRMILPNLHTQMITGITFPPSVTLDYIFVDNPPEDVLEHLRGVAQGSGGQVKVVSHQAMRRLGQ